MGGLSVLTRLVPVSTRVRCASAQLLQPRRAPAAPPCCRRMLGHTTVMATAAAAEPPKGKKMVLVVAAALINDAGQVLLAQRPEGKAMAGLWEFPGGKLEWGLGETPEEALARELREELDVVVATANMLPLTFASHTYESFHLLMPTFACYEWDGEPKGAEGQNLMWVGPQELDQYAMPEADIPLIEPVVAAMAKAKRR